MASFSDSMAHLRRLHDQLQAECDQVTAEKASLLIKLDELHEQLKKSPFVNNVEHEHEQHEKRSVSPSSLILSNQPAPGLVTDNVPFQPGNSEGAGAEVQCELAMPWKLESPHNPQSGVHLQTLRSKSSVASVTESSFLSQGPSLAETKSKDLKQMFRYICTHENLDPQAMPHTRFLSPQSLAELCQKHSSMLSESAGTMGQTMADTAASFAESICRLQKALHLSPHGSSRDSGKLNFRTFQALVTEHEEDLQGKVDASDWDTLLLVRHCLIKESVSGVISEATRVDRHDLLHYIMDSDGALILAIESAISLAIVANALIMGLSTDIHPRWDGWIYIELGFTIIFAVELCLKICLTVYFEGSCYDGLHRHFFKKGASMNILDFIVVVCGIFDCIDTAMGAEKTILGNISVARLVRLFRLTRLFKVLRFKLFRNLLLLLNGAVLGMHILLWALILLLFVVYCCGLLLRQTIGEHFAENKCSTYGGCASESERILDEDAENLFGSVPRSMFTVFRCVTGDCTAINGTPLPVMLANTHGYLFTIPYVLTIVFVTFGLFNLIMAVFVENTLENAKFDDTRRRELKQSEHVRTARMLEHLLWKFIMAQDRVEGKRHSYSNKGTQALAQRVCVKISLETFEHVITDREVQRILDDLDIPLHSRRKLFDTLDADGNGTLSIQEIASGIVKLRGPADKTDIISVLLISQRMQGILHNLEIQMHHMQDTLTTFNTRVGNTALEPSKLQPKFDGSCIGEDLHIDPELLSI